MMFYWIPNPAISVSSSSSIKGSQEKYRHEAIEKVRCFPLKEFISEDEILTWRTNKLREELNIRGLDWSNLRKKEMRKLLTDQNSNLKGESCCICCDEYKEGDILRVIPCTHEFHVECIDKWVMSSSTDNSAIVCPLCKGSI